MRRSRLALGLAFALSSALAPLALAQALTKLPMPQSFRPDELRVQWETDSAPAGATHALDWGTSSPTQNSVGAAQTVELAADRFVHRARSGGTTSAIYGFRTARAPDAPFRMAFLADNQDQSGVAFTTVLARVDAAAPDAIGHAGDTVQNGDQPLEWQAQWFDPLAAVANLGQRIPVLLARGNHDGYSALAQTYHWLPGSGRWYAETIGRVRFVFLDSNAVDAAQEAFLDAELGSPATQAADFRIVVFHHPPYSNLWSDPGYNGHPYQRTNWVPRFEQHRVDLVISGHGHSYQRGSQNVVTYLVVGGAGGELDTVASAAPWPFLVRVVSAHHFALLDAAPGHLTWTAYALDGSELDRFELGRGTPEVPVFPIGGAAR